MSRTLGARGGLQTALVEEMRVQQSTVGRLAVTRLRPHHWNRRQHYLRNQWKLSDSNVFLHLQWS